MPQAIMNQIKILLNLELSQNTEITRKLFTIHKNRNSNNHDLICEEPNKHYSKITLTPEQLNICIEGEQQAYYKIIISETNPKKFKFIYSMTLYGGAFSPFHNGHHESLLSLIKLLSNNNHQLISNIFLLPSSKSNYQHKKILISNNIKKLMLENYLSDLNEKLNIKINLNSIELDQGGVSYTIKTLENINRQYLSYGINLNLFFYTSTESLSKITQWKNYKDIFKQANIIMCSRLEKNNSSEKINLSSLELTEIKNKNILIQLNLAPDPNKNSGHIYILKADLPICSSTDIRNKIANDDNSWQEQTPEAISKFIVQHKLYS